MSPIKRFLIFFVLLLAFSLPAYAAEVFLESSGNAEEIISMTSFADSDTIPNPAQAENFVALGLMYHSTGGYFLPHGTLSNSLALRLVFRTVGREDEAAALAYNHAERNAAGLGNYDDFSWADGYYLLALKEGLINADEFSDAFSNPDSPLTRDRDVSAQNLIKWMTIAHKVPLANYELPSDVYIDSAYRIYYSSLLKYGFFTASDVEYFAPWRYIDRDDTALLLEKFEGYILSKLGIRSNTGTVNCINIKFSGSNYVRSVSYISSGTTYTVQSCGKNIDSPFADISGETVVFGKGQPDISGVLRNGDKIKVYYKENQVVFIRVMHYNEQEDLSSQAINFSGSLYLYDPTEKTLTLNISDQLKDFYLSHNVCAYRRTGQISPSELSLNALDSDCTIYLKSPVRGGLYRVYSVITN